MHSGRGGPALGRVGEKKRGGIEAVAGVAPSSIANPQSLMGLPIASHSTMSQCPHPSLAVYSQGQRGGFGLNIEGP